MAVFVLTSLTVFHVSLLTSVDLKITISSLLRPNFEQYFTEHRWCAVVRITKCKI